ncbi:beta strand repeat-containing protein [Flaviaesturariibacter amylovorans]|uniref:Secretion system C-terminal sorting domain-containing protein n=1 Tax=Flaviaesturariibacter amylovorans TaxID=1084520 RepID=A0ABP8HVB2_9BACT
MSTFLSCRLVVLLALFATPFVASAQTTVTYPQQVANYYSTYSTGTAGAFNQGSTQVGMYANGGGTKQVVSWRKFRTDGGAGSSSDRALQVGDQVVITLSATRANGRIGFALLSSPAATGSWNDRESNYAFSMNLDGPAYNSGNWGNWYFKGAAIQATSFGGSTGYLDYTFTLTLMAPDRMNVTLTNGSSTLNYFDVQLANANPITDYSIFLDDDWNGSANSNLYWGLASGGGHTVRNTGALQLGASGNSFTVAGIITSGLNANSATITSVPNSLTKSGSGTLTLSGANTYTGITINSGKVSVSAIGDMGVASGLGTAPNTSPYNLFLSSGALTYTGATASTNRPWAIRAGTTGTIEITEAGTTLTMSGASAAAAASPLIKTGPGTLELTGALNHTGLNTVSAGTLRLARSGGTTLLAGSDVTVASGATLRISTDQSLGNLTVNSGGTLTVDPGVNLTLTGTVTFSGATTFGAGSTTTFAGTGQAIPAANYHHFATSGSGSKSFPAPGTIGVAGTFTVSGAIPSIAFNTTIDFNGTGAQTIPAYSYGTVLISGDRGGATISFGSNTISIGGSMSYTATNAVQDPGTSTVRYGSGQTIIPLNYYNVVLNGSGGYLVSGTVNIAGSLSWAVNPPTLLSTSSTVNFNGVGPQTIPAASFHNLTISGDRLGNTVTLAAGTLNVAGTFNPSATNVVYSSTGNTVNYSSSSTQTIYSPFTYNNLSNSGNGGRTFNSGTVAILGTYTPTTGVNVPGGTIDFASGGTQTIPSGTYNDLSNSGGGPRTLASSGANNGVIEIQGSFTPGSGSYTVDNSTVQLTGTAGSTTDIPVLNAASTPANPLARNYHKLILSGASNTVWKLATNETLSTVSDLTQTNGEFQVCGNALGSNSVTIGGNYVKNIGQLYVSKNYGAGSLTIEGNLTNTMGNVFVSGFATSSAPSGGGSLTVNGNVTMSSGALSLIFDANAPSTHLAVGGNLDLAGGILRMEEVANNLAVATVSVAGNLLATANATNVVSFGGAGTSHTAGNRVTLYGNLIKNSTNGTFQSLGTTLPDGFVFAGTGTQVLSYNGSVSNYVPYTVNAGSTVQLASNWALGTLTSRLPHVTINGTLDAGTYKISGMAAGATFTLNGTLLTGSVNGVDDNTAASTLGGLGALVLRDIPPTASVVYTGTGMQLVNAPATLANVTIDNPANVVLTGPFAITGTLTLAKGVLEPGANLLDVKGSIARNGTTQTGTIGDGSGIIRFSGSSAQSVPAGALGLVNDLTIQNSAGVSLGSDVDVLGILALNDGLLDLGAATLSVPAGSTTGGSATSYVKTSGAGALKLTGIGAGGGVFPVGNSTYNPMTLAQADGLDWSVRVEDAVGNVQAPYTGNVAKAVSRVWDINPSVRPVVNPATVTFGYDDTDPLQVGGSFNPAADVVVWHYTAGFWLRASDPITPGSTGGLRTVTVSGLTEFSPYAIANVGAPLPVSLMTFTGKRVNGVNELKWVTASESNNRGFSVERSTDGRTYTSVGFVASRAQGGNSSSIQNYSFIDNPSAGSGQAGRKWYYRLRQEDLDGRTKLSTIVVLSADKSGNLVVDGVYPNPAKGAVSVRLQGGAQSGAVILQLTDIQGRTVKVQSIALAAGTSTTATIDLAGLAAGQYHLKALAADGTTSETITLVKQ